MGNQQLYILNEDTKQLLLTAKLGDGHLTIPKNSNSNSCYYTNCIYKEYLEHKKSILRDLSFDITYVEKNGYAGKPIFCLSSKKHVEITKIKNMSLEDTLSSLNDYGIALWFYDDGSLHKDKLFYNLNTHSFSKEIQENLFIPFFNKYNIFPKVTKEIKKNGNIYYYLRISKFEGAYEISEILNKYKINCYSYKVWSSETSQKWRKLQVQLKSMTIDISNSKKGKLLELDSVEDIVRSLEKFKASRWYKTRARNNETC
ncbi:MAG TPA: hypothetical protein PKD00_00325 [Burkholderiales bacterium]|nr:hypothetical protein [Burkholderiales bacterium]